MKKILAIVVSLLLMLIAVSGFAAQMNGSAEYDPHRVIVKFRPRSRLLALSSSERNRAPIARLKALVPLKPDGGSRVQPLAGGVERIFVAQIGEGELLEDVLRELAANPDVEYAEPDYIGHGEGFVRPSAAAPNSAEQPPADPDFGWQWGFRNTGQPPFTGTPGMDANVLPAWNITTGDSSTILAVLDTGIALNHPDFAGRIIPGKNFVDPTKDVADDYGHGTNVSSVAAATGGNGTGIAGLNWKCRILPLKILDGHNSGLYSWWASAFIYAADQGADVINISAGGSGRSQALADAVAYAQAQGVIVVACMMNTNNETPYYPAAYPDVIAVGAIDPQGARVVPFCYSATTGSNYGSHIAFVAPGNYILGLNYQDFTQTSYWCGTSQATPFVSGLVTLMFAINPALTYQQAYSALKAGARDGIGPATEDAPGWDKYFGWGLIDAYRSLLAVPSAPSTYFPQVAVGGGYTTTFTLVNTGADTAAGILLLTGEKGTPLNAALASPGFTDAAGGSFPISVPAGGTQTITASSINPADATQAGWARIQSSSTSLEGVATFQFRQQGALATIVGVLSADKTDRAAIPLDDDHTQARDTGYAVANPGSGDIYLSLNLLNPDGSISKSIAPSALNPLGPGCHVARFVWEDLNDPDLKFRGSMIVSAQGGETFSVVALVLNQGLYTAVPVTAGSQGGASGTENYFPQVAFGGGYKTVFTFLNPGSVESSGTVFLTDNDGKPLNAMLSSPGLAGATASTFPLRVPPGGVQAVTATAVSPGDGTTAGAARIEISGGSLDGVATFEVTDQNRLTTIVGVLGAPATNAATIPVDDDKTLGEQSHVTGYAISNPGEEDISIRLVMVNPDGSTARMLDSLPLKAGGHVSRFFWEDLADPDFRFRGSFVLIAEAGKTFSVVAMVLNQGLYTAIPAIPTKVPQQGVAPTQDLLMQQMPRRIGPTGPTLPMRPYPGGVEARDVPTAL